MISTSPPPRSCRYATGCLTYQHILGEDRAVIAFNKSSGSNRRLLLQVDFYDIFGCLAVCSSCSIFNWLWSRATLRVNIVLVLLYSARRAQNWPKHMSLLKQHALNKIKKKNPFYILASAPYWDLHLKLFFFFRIMCLVSFSGVLWDLDNWVFLCFSVH